MADILDLGSVPIVVGQQVQFMLTIPNYGTNSVWLVCADASVIAPVSATGAPLTWPHEVTLINGVGTYFLHGVSSGVASYLFRTSSDPGNSTSIASASIGVSIPSGQVPPPGDETVVEIIAEPIIITIISQPPTTTTSD